MSEAFDLTTYYAKRIIGDSAASTESSALLQTGTGITNDTWILHRTNRSTNSKLYGIKYAYDGTSGHDKIEYYGKGTSDNATAWIQLDTGDASFYDIYGNSAEIKNNIKITSKSRGLYLTDSSGTQYAGIYDNNSNLWIGATSSTGQHHKGSTFISAGHNGTTGNKSIYISIPADGNATTTHTSYALVYKDATGGSTTPIYVNSDGKTVACDAYSTLFTKLSWTAGTSAGPVLDVTVGGTNKTATIPSASASASGIVTNAAQTFGGIKTFYREGTTENNYACGIAFSNKDTTTGQTQTGGNTYIYAYNTHATSDVGMNMVIRPGGNLFIGGGESAASLYSTLTTSTSENLYATADTAIYLEANANTIANRIGIAINTSGAIIPVKAEASNNNAQDIGTSSNKWANVYATNFVGNASSATQVKVTNLAFPSSGSQIYYPTLAGSTTTGNQDIKDSAHLYLFENTTTSYLNIGSGSSSGGITVHNANGKYTDIVSSAFSSNRVLTLPDATGTICLTSHTHGWANLTDNADSLTEGTSNWTDNTEILTSYASNNGFADTNAKGKVYRRDAICAYNYIKSKASGSWGISITGSAASAAKLTLISSNTASTSTDTYATNGLNIRWFSETGKLPGQPSQWGFLLTMATTDGGSEVHQIFAQQANGSLYHRGTNSSNYTSPPAFATILDTVNWRKLIFANKNISRSTLTVSDSTWAVTSGTDVFGLSFKDTGLTYTPSGGSATASSDPGDWRGWLTCDSTSNNVTFNMRIDGSFQANNLISSSTTTIGGDLLFTNSGTTTRQIRGVVGDNDYWRIAGGATAANSGWMEIATADDGTEPIYVRQYTGAYTTITRTATLLDSSGNTSFPGQVSCVGRSTTDTTAANYYHTGGIQIYESNLVGNTQDNFAYAPRIGFHWRNRIAATLSFHKDGIFYFRNQNGTTRATVDANLSGIISRAGVSKSWYQGRDSAIIKTTSYSGYDAILSMKTTAGDWSLGVYTNNVMYFTYILDSNYSSNTNTVTKQFIFNPDGTLTATKFSGNLTGNVTGNCSGSSGSCTGNAATATNVAWTGITSNPGIYTNDVSGSSYGNVKITTAKGGYYGFLVGTSTSCMNVMSSGQHNGLYCQAKGRWMFYYDSTNDRCAIGTSTTTANYILTVGGDTYINGNLKGNNTKTIGTTAIADHWYKLYLGGATAGSNAINSANPLIEFSDSDRSQYGQLIYTDFDAVRAPDGLTWVGNQANSWFQAPRVFGAVWNDYAEYRETKEEIQPGRCVVETGNGDLVLSTERLQGGCEIVSDTFGFAIGYTKTCKTPTACAGRVLAYLYEDNSLAKPGDPVCSGPNGTVSLMTHEEEIEWPSRIIATVSEIPTYDEWEYGSADEFGVKEKLKVDGRIWIRIR